MQLCASAADWHLLVVVLLVCHGLGCVIAMYWSFCHDTAIWSQNKPLCGWTGRAWQLLTAILYCCPLRIVDDFLSIQLSCKKAWLGANWALFEYIWRFGGCCVPFAGSHEFTKTLHALCCMPAALPSAPVLSLENRAARLNAVGRV